MAGCCGCGVEAARLHARQRRVLRIVLAVNAATFLLMLGAALHGRSSALLSGALDNLGDALTYALSLAVVGAPARAKALPGIGRPAALWHNAAGAARPGVSF